MKRLLLRLLLASLLLMSALPAHAAPNVEMKAEVAGGGRVRFGGWVTILVDLTNQGGEFDAELVAAHMDGPVWERSPEYVVPLTLPAGGKKRVPLDVPVFNGGTVRVQLRFGSAVVQEKSISLMSLAPEALFAGVLSDDELGIPALARLGGGREGAVQVARLSAATFPSSAALLESYDILALARFDTGSMGKEQLQALESWVGRGGTLLLAGGPEWKRSFAALPPSLVPVQITGVGDAEMTGLETLAGKPLTGKAPVSQGQAQGGEVLASAGSVPLVVVGRVGAGKVVYLAADPSLQPLAGWAGLPDLLDRLLSGRTHSDFSDTGNIENMMMSALQQLPGLGLPSALLLGSLLGGYLLLIGPISYVILKRRDRREWLWVTVPVLSMTFVGVVYGVGFSKQVNMISHVITLTELSPGTRTATHTSYVGVYAPSRTRLDIDLGQERLVRPIISYSGRDGERSTRVVHGDKTTVQLLDLNNYSMKGFSIQEDIALGGGLELTGVSIDDAGNLQGKIVNRLDRAVRSLQVTAGGTWQNVGNLEPGQTSEPFVLDLAEVGRSPKGAPVFVQTFGPDANNEANRRHTVLNALFGWERNQVTAGAITIVGWTDEPLAAVDLPQLGRTTRGTNLVYSQAPIPVDLSRGEIPPGVVIGVHSGGPGFGRSPYGYSLGPGAHTFRMTLPPVDPAKVAEVRLHSRVLGSSAGYKLAIKNQKTGLWTDLTDEPVQALKGWQDFVATGGLVEIQIDVREHAEISSPTISVKGVSR